LPISIFWFRRDLRLHDNTALIQATDGKYPVLPVFIFNKNILTKIDTPDDASVTFIHSTLASLKVELEQFETTLLTFHDTVENAFQWIFKYYHVKIIYTNRDYEPAAIARDKNIEKPAEKAGAHFHTFKDQVLFEASEVLKQDGSPFKVFTPYKKARFTRYIQSNLPEEPAFPDIHNFMKTEPAPFPALSELGF
jgi:deoxyribodipyrimidine photo-lyase